MSSKVIFYGKNYVTVGFQNRHVTPAAPEVFDNAYDGYARLGRIDVNGSIYPLDGDMEKPYFYFRATDTTNGRYRFGNIVELGDGFLSTQKGVLHPELVADDTTPLVNYRKISETPLVYGVDSTEKKVEYRFKEDGLYVNEGDFFFAKYEPWPICIYEHHATFQNASCMFQPCTLIGTLDGRPFIGLGEFERIHMHQNKGDFTTVPFGYIYFGLYGIRQDGRREIFLSSLSTNGDGRSYCVYYIDGELPIVSTEVMLEADWQHLPYVDDGTCTFPSAVIRFCDKEIHYEAKWGTKGFLKRPRIERHGQSQSFGTWYVGNTPYAHRLSSCIYEGMDVYDEKLKKLGFTVID